jgi:hypothetical protein
VLIIYPCPNCRGSGQKERPDPRVPGVMLTYACPSCRSDPGFQRRECVSLSELRRLLDNTG